MEAAALRPQRLTLMRSTNEGAQTNSCSDWWDRAMTWFGIGGVLIARREQNSPLFHSTERKYKLGQRDTTSFSLSEHTGLCRNGWVLPFKPPRKRPSSATPIATGGGLQKGGGGAAGSGAWVEC